MSKAVTFFLILLIIGSDVAAQLSFLKVDTVKVTDQSSPLVNPWAGGFNYATFCEIDLNGDNIMDLVAFEPGGPPGHKRLMPFLNYGTPGKVDYHYAPQYISCLPDLKGFMLSYDYNHDGKMDLFSLSYATNAGIMVYRNDYTVGSGLKFTMVQDPILTKYLFGSFNVFANPVAVPALVDVDNDGDMDIISWPPTTNGTLEYQQNLAVDSGWSFDSLRFINTTSTYYNQSLCWGGFALEVYTVVDSVKSFGNLCLQTARYEADADSYEHAAWTILVFDNDGDGLKDALIGGLADNNALFVHNAGTFLRDSIVLKDSMDYQVLNFPDYNVPVSLPSFANFSYFDADNDGIKDLIVTSHDVSNFRGTLFYKNTGLTNHPVFALQPHMFLQEDMIEVGSAAAPVLFDYDADGLPDLLIGDESHHDPSGSDHKGISLYKNTGTATNPQFQLITRDYAAMDALNGLTGTICPTFGDLDGDGDPDMITGTGNGQLLYFENIAGSGNPANFIAPNANYQGIDVGNYSAPQLYDLNHDGLLDLIIGNQTGIIKYYQNSGTINNPVFTLTKDTLGGINVQYPGFATGFASPFFYNDSNTDKLILGTELGKLYIYDGINGNISGNYHLADSLINGEEGQRLIPFLGDINHDGHPDMLVGNYNGGLSLYMNKDTTNLYTGLKSEEGKVVPSFDVFPNPASDKLNMTFYHIQNGHANLEIINSVGQYMYYSVITEQKVTIPLTSFSNGIYLVRFVSDGNTQSQKIIVTRH